MNTLRFHFAVENGAATLRPTIDGLDLLQGHANSQGLDPERLLPPLSSLLLPTGAGQRVLIGSCRCGETGCGSLALHLSRAGGQVLWEPDEDAPDESLSRCYRFDLLQYLDAIDEASANRPREGRGSRVARRVRLALGLHDQRCDTLRIFGTASVGWVAATSWEGGALQVSLTGPGGQRVLEFAARWGESEEQLVARVVAEVDEWRYADDADSPRSRA